VFSPAVIIPLAKPVNQPDASMKNPLPHLFAAAACSMVTLPALADTAPHSGMPAQMSTSSLASSSAQPAAQDLPLAAASQLPLLLADDALDAIDAGGLGTGSYGVATADRGRVFSFSAAQLVSSRIVTVSLSQSIAFASGTNVRADTGATAGAQSGRW
jgi:hypothetical protein